MGAVEVYSFVVGGDLERWVVVAAAGRCAAAGMEMLRESARGHRNATHDVGDMVV